MTITSSDGTKLAAISLAVGLGAATAAGLAYLYKQKLNNTPPKKWRRVGEISEIFCFPIKSCAPIRKSEIQCNQLGVQDGHLRDRVFMVITPEGQFLTARANPKLVLVQPTVIDDRMLLSAPGMLDFEFSISALYEKSPITVSVWQQPVSAIDCGEEAAKWLSRYLFAEDIGVRLVFYANTLPTREVRPKGLAYRQLTPNDVGALPDFSSFMLVNENSVTELNSRIEKDARVVPLNFRPNFVVKGSAKPFEEDNWKWVRIGNDIIFRNLKPCTRCIFTNINPFTAKRSLTHEPITTLKKYRILTPNEPPVMGIHLGVRVKGQVAVGDSVYVEDTN